jgi:Spy/CpxP family protein refolding chaperone
MRSITSAALAAAVAGALALGAVQVASAQSDQGQGGQGDRRACMHDAMAKMNLSDEQKAKLKELHDSGVKGPDRQEAMAKILSPEQQAQLRDARKACGGGGHQG